MSGQQLPLLSLIAALAISLGPATSQTPLPEAPSGFDDGSIEPDPMNLHVTKDKMTFDEVEQIGDGLGPIYNAQSCRECHQNPVSGAGSQITETRVGHVHNGVFQNPSVPIVGDVIKGRTLINDRAICLNAQEHIPPNNEVRTKRLSLSIFGDGFIESISDASILAVRNSQCNTNTAKPAGTAAICGVAQFVDIAESPGIDNQRLGRFGWKNQHASLLSFAADAYLNEMGITSRFNGVSDKEFTEVCNPPGIPEPNDAKPDPGTDDIVTFARFMRATKTPPRLIQDPNAVNRGEALFRQIGCAVCHVERFETVRPGTKLVDATGTDAFVVTDALGSKTIHPYSDFLLHDVGTGDGIALAIREHYGPEVAQRSVAADIAKLHPLLSEASRNALMAGGALQEHTHPSPSVHALDADTAHDPVALRELRYHDACAPRELAKINTPQESALAFVVQCATHRLRTPPLWGIHQRNRYMHDGETLRIEEAIARHREEATGVTANFNNLSPNQKQDLVAFVGSL